MYSKSSVYQPAIYCLRGTSPLKLNRPDKHRDKRRHTQKKQKNTQGENIIT